MMARLKFPLLERRWARGIARLLLPLLGASMTTAAAGNSLSSRSPFLPSGFQPPGETTAPSPRATAPGSLEFRGFYRIADRYYFLVSPRNQVGRWLAQGETEEGVTINQFDAESTRVLVNYNGQSLWVDLAETAALTGAAPSQLAGIQHSGQGSAARDNPGNAGLREPSGSGIVTARNGRPADNTVARSVVRPGQTGGSGVTTPRIPRYPIPGRSFSGTVNEPLNTPMAPPSPPTVQAPDFIPPKPPAEEPPPPVLR